MQKLGLSLGLFLLLALGAGCKDCKGKPLPTTCKKMFARCQLPGGPIGICQLSSCRPGQKKPCLGCVSQH